MLSLWMCWSPVLFMVVLAVGLKRSAFEMSIACCLYTVLITFFYFDTPLSVITWSALDGVVTTLPLLLVVFTGIFLSTILIHTGTFQRITEWLMSGLKSTLHRDLLITFGIGNFMEGAAVIAEPVVAPMLRAAHVSPTGSAALPLIGYAGLMTLELAGIIIAVLAIVTGLPIQELALASGWLSIPAMILMGVCAFFFLPTDTPALWRFVLPVCCGAFTGFVALVAVAYIGFSISGMLGGLALILVFLLFGNQRLPFNAQVIRDLLPFSIVLMALLTVNLLTPVRNLTFDQFVLPISVTPIHTITLRPFFSPYLYLFLSCILSIILFRIPRVTLSPLLRKSFFVAVRVSITMALFGAMGQILSTSGYAAGFTSLNTENNIPSLIANHLKSHAGSYYPMFVPLLGWVGTFLTGYGVASLMLFGQLQIDAAHLLGLSPVWLAAGLAVGSSVGSISSPFKIALGTPLCDALGQEGAILRKTIPMGLACSLILGVILWLVA